MDRWAGRVALVTGASSGIGAVTAEALVNHGMKVVGCARNVQRIKDLSEKLQSEQGKLYAVRCDVSSEKDILDMFQQIKDDLGGVDVCINNAGVSLVARLLTGTTEAWKQILDVNILGLSICTREAVKSMRERGVDDGHVIHLNSILGKRLPSQASDVIMYSVSKWAVTALTEGLRNELREIKSNIRVSQISPGLVRTEIMHRMFGDEIGNKILHGRPILEVSDIVDGLIYMLSAPQHVQVHDIIVLPKPWHAIP